MKFLVDTQLPVALARWLTARGHDAVHVLDRGWSQNDDRQLWSDAAGEERIMVSKDEDFFILATRPDDPGKLLELRLDNSRKQALLDAMEKAWPSIEAAFQSGQRIVEVR